MTPRRPNKVHRRPLKRAHVLFISVALESNLTPLLRIATELAQSHADAYEISFATHDEGQHYVDRVNQDLLRNLKKKEQTTDLYHEDEEDVEEKLIHFVSAGALPLSRGSLQRLFQKTSENPSIFSSILSLVNELYVPMTMPVYDNIRPMFEHGVLPDLVVYDIGTLGASFLVQKFNLPFLINSPSLTFDVDGRRNVEGLPTFGTGFSTEMSFGQRCFNLFSAETFSVALTASFMRLNQLRVSIGLEPIKSQYDLVKGARILVNTAFGFDIPRAISPLVDLTGPIVPMDYAVPKDEVYAPLRKKRSHAAALPRMIHEWLQGQGRRRRRRREEEEEEEDHQECTTSALSDFEFHPKPETHVILIHFSAMTKLSSSQVLKLTKALEMIHTQHEEEKNNPFRALWIIPKDEYPHVLSMLTPVPDYVRIQKSDNVPLLRLMSHTAIRVVLCDCDLALAQEALYYGKPLLCIPHSMEQFDVAARVFDSNTGLVIRDKLTTTSAQDLLIHVDRLLAPNGTSRRAARDMKNLLHLSGGLPRAIDVVEEMVHYAKSRHGHPQQNRANLQTLESSLPAYQVQMLDVVAVYLSFVCLLLLLLHLMTGAFLSSRVGSRMLTLLDVYFSGSEKVKTD